VPLRDFDCDIRLAMINVVRMWVRVCEYLIVWGRITLVFSFFSLLVLQGFGEACFGYSYSFSF
jgi:hypothetical protein